MENMLEQAHQALLHAGQNGRIFSVEFRKRTDGSLRKLNGRFGVRKGVKGVGLSFDPVQKNLVGVYDIQIKAFRFIPLEGVVSITGRKQRKVL